jgi:transaldolase
MITQHGQPESITQLKALNDLGQSVWLDFISRDLLKTGELRRLIELDGISGLTSNPVIFEKAITTTDSYDATLGERLGIETLIEKVTTDDIREAADLFHTTFQATDRRDGYVSLEVSPRLAWDEDGTVAEAHRLWRLVDRANLMIKVPGTPPGVCALRRLIACGINVNVTLLFSVEVYESVVDAYFAGMQEFVRSGGDAAQIASVASFFVSRIDTAFDPVIATRRESATGEERRQLDSLRGTVAIANARLAYEHYLSRFKDSCWTELATRTGAHPQRLLWASTGTKDPSYSDVLYVEALAGPETVNTMPPATMSAFRDHGCARPKLVEELGEARTTLNLCHNLGLPFDLVTERLLQEGVALFSEAEEKLASAVARKVDAMLA